MTRYFNSFIITSILYSIVIGWIFYTSSNKNIIIAKKEASKKISLKHIELVKKIEAKPIVVEKDIKEPIPKVIKKKIKKIVKKKEIVAKKVLEKEPIISTISSIPPKKIVKNDLDLEISKYKKDFLEKNLLLIKKHIQNNVKYSKRAKRMNIQGDVLIQFNLSKDGTINNIKAISGHKLLRKSTIKAIFKASSFFPRVNQNITIQVPITYKLI